MKEILEKIGLTAGEAEVYEILAHLGVSNAGMVIKKAQLASSKVYDVLAKLHAKGLVSFVIRNGVRQYEATPPERLLDFLEQKKSELANAQEDVRKLLPKLQTMRSEIKDESHITVYSGLWGAAIALKESIEEGKKGGELLGFGTDEDPYLTFLPSQLREHFEEQKKHNIKWKLVFTNRFASPNPLAEIRYLPEGFILPVRTMIFGNKVAIVDFTEPITTIIITKKQIADAYREQFYYFWERAQPQK